MSSTTKQAFILLNTTTGKSQTVSDSSRIADCNKIWYDRVFHNLLEIKYALEFSLSSWFL